MQVGSGAARGPARGTARSVRAALGCGLVAAFALAVLVGLVLAHTTDRLDDAAQTWTWSHRGSVTEALLRLVRLLSPGHVLLVVLLVAVTRSVRVRSPRPALVCGVTSGVATVAELGMKWTLPRVESLLGGSGVGGFPSGHVVGAVAYSGALLLALEPRPRLWQQALVVGLGCGMSAAVLLTSLHTVTEVGGSWALSWLVLCAASAGCGIWPVGGEHPEVGDNRGRRGRADVSATTLHAETPDPGEEASKDAGQRHDDSGARQTHA